MIGRHKRVVGSGKVGRLARCSGDRARGGSFVIEGIKRVIGSGEVRVVGGNGGSGARA